MTKASILLSHKGHYFVVYKLYPFSTMGISFALSMMIPGPNKGLPDPSSPTFYRIFQQEPVQGTGEQSSARDELIESPRSLSDASV